MGQFCMLKLLCKVLLSVVIILLKQDIVSASNVTVMQTKKQTGSKNVEHTSAEPAGEVSNHSALKAPVEPLGMHNEAEELEKLCKDHSLLLPALVPLSDEVCISGILDLNENNVGELERRCVLLKKDCNRNSLGLFRGRILFDCKNDVHLVTPDASVDIERGSVVYVYSTGESVVILNLHDLKRKAVLVSVAGEKIELPPGRELLITRYGSLKFDEARLCPGIWYRSVYELANKHGLKIYETQFSTISAAAIFPSVRKMVAKGNKSGEKLAKTFAAVITVSRDRQAFRPCMKSEPGKLTVVSSKP